MDMTNHTNLKFAIFGVGGTGGVIGGYLANAGNDVTFLARGAHLAAKAEALEKVMRAADIHAHFTDDIQRDALTKFSFVSPMGAAGLYFDVTSEAFQVPGEVRETFIGLIKEVEALGHAMGITFDRDLVATDLRLMDAFAPGLTTSMQRDVASGGPSEFAGLVSRIVTLGQKYHVPVPPYTKIDTWGKAHGLA